VVSFFTIVGALASLLMVPEVRKVIGLPNKFDETQQTSSEPVSTSTPIMSTPAATPSIQGLFVGESYKFSDDDTVYYYGSDHMFHPVATGEAYFRIYNCPEARFDRCHTVQLMPSAIHKNSPILKGSIIERLTPCLSNRLRERDSGSRGYCKPRLRVRRSSYRTSSRS
jgi:hypothetical protein